jgi:hypothetical protein
LRSFCDGRHDSCQFAPGFYRSIFEGGKGSHVCP